MQKYTLKELAKKYKQLNQRKNYRGWYEATKGSKSSKGAVEIKNAGNVLYNNAFFNQAMGSIDPSVNISGVGTADGGIGMVSSAPASGGAMGESFIYYELLNEGLSQSFELVPYISENGRNYFQEYMDELKSSKPKLFKRTENNLIKLKILGNKIKDSSSKNLEDGIFELRSESQEGWSRIFYFFDEGKVIILANGFDKKSNKTPQSELNRAKELKKDYERRFK